VADKIRRGTTCFVQNNNKLLLALIEYSPTDRKWAGIGGFVEEGETLEETVVREAKEETYIDLDPNSLRKVAELNGSFQLSIFFTSKWSGEIKAKEPSLKELKWFPINELPYSQMHPGTENWLPKVLEGKLIRVTNHQAEEVVNFLDKS
jgi:ADP-ribose pyrophosphatase YjhB (NUDIX family)